MHTDFMRTTMSLAQMNAATIEVDAPDREYNVLKDRLARLSKASIRISETLDLDAALQQIVESA